MQCFGFSLPLTMSTLIAYIILFFTHGFTNKKDIIVVGQFFYLDKPQGKSTLKRMKSILFVSHSTGFEIVGNIFDWISGSLAIKNENNKSCVVSNI